MRKYTLFLLISLLIAPFLAQAISPIYSINKSINKTYTKNGVYPLPIKKPIYGLQITADVNLPSGASLVRVILTDITGKEYLVFEGSPIINKQGIFSINNYCEETCVLNRIIPISLKIQTLNGSITLKSISTVDSANKLNLSSGNTPLTQVAKLKIQQTTLKISKINKFNTQNSKKWTAGLSSVCQMTYSQKRQLFKDSKGVTPDYVPNLQGFDCYKSGIFSLAEDVSSKTTLSSAPMTTSPTITLPDKWDWRNVNGENWNTPVKNQGNAGTCAYFGSIAALESSINLYYNQHLDINLSEMVQAQCGQDIYKNICSNINNAVDQMICRARDFGIPEEVSYPYNALDVDYETCNVDSNYKTRLWKVNDFEHILPPSSLREFIVVDNKIFGNKVFYRNELLPYGGPEFDVYRELRSSISLIKNKIIKNGPLIASFRPWTHAMVVEGWGNDIMISPYGETSNQPYFIVKNSWGTDWGETGYGKILIGNSEDGEFGVVVSPITPPTDHVIGQRVLMEK